QWRCGEVNKIEGSKMDTYITRLCWNDANWTSATGSASRLEGKKTFNSQHGFGFEEWLFSPKFTFESWRYGFVQGVNPRQKSLKGQQANLLLFTIGPDKKRYLVGDISPIHVLTTDEADRAHA